MLAIHKNRVRGSTHWHETPELRDADLCLVCCARAQAAPALVETVRAAYPDAHIIGTTTAGQIAGSRPLDDEAVLTVVRLEHGRVRLARASTAGADFARAGATLSEALAGPDLRLVFMLCEGLRMNGSELVRGLADNLPPSVVIGGCLSADGTRFEHTAILDGAAWVTDTAVAVGLYGEALEVGQGSLGGWHPFGPDRLVTRSEGNTVYSFDDEPALDLYIRYLGKYASGLPASALRFPLSVHDKDSAGLVRTALSIDEETRSVTYAGDVTQGCYARLMRANLDRLVDGAQGAAEQARLAEPPGAVLALLVSCVGRRTVLGPRTEEELEVVVESLGSEATVAGFYSYGEFGRSRGDPDTRLTNQTMTIVTVAER
ncbi:MAG: hypothetical protein ACI8PZ_006531 [Myxococcota bacterium]|jgi:hypothetical protein